MELNILFRDTLILLKRSVRVYVEYVYLTPHPAHDCKKLQCTDDTNNAVACLPKQRYFQEEIEVNPFQIDEFNCIQL